MNSQTITELKITTPPSESLWHFLANLPTTQEANTLYALLLAGFLGALAHYVTRWAKGDIEGGLIAYMFIDNPRRSVLAGISLFSELVAEIGSGIFTSADGVFVGWALVLVMGFKSGFLIDSIANKAARPEWTTAQRVAAGATPKDQEVQKAVLPTIGDKP